MVTNLEFIERAKAMLGHPYIWGEDFQGASAQVTFSNLLTAHRRDPIHFTLDKCVVLFNKFLNMYGGDCSGLVTYGMKLPKMHSSSIWAKCISRRALPSINNTAELVNAVGLYPPGSIIYRVGHIGIVIDSTHILESGSTTHGVTITHPASPQTKKAWTHIGKIPLYVTYVDNSPSTPEQPEAAPTFKTFNVRVISKTLEIRTGPNSVRFPSVGRLKNGQIAQVLATNPEMTWGRIGDDRWICIKPAYVERI